MRRQCSRLRKSPMRGLALRGPWRNEVRDDESQIPNSKSQIPTEEAGHFGISVLGFGFWDLVTDVRKKAVSPHGLGDGRGDSRPVPDWSGPDLQRHLHADGCQPHFLYPDL